MSLPVYSRADLSRIVSIVVPLFLTAVSTSAVAREFRAADTRSEDYPTVQALRFMGRAIAERSGDRLQIRVIHSPADDRKLFRDAAIQSSQFMRGKWKDLEQRSRRQAEAARVMITTNFDRKPFEDAVAGICAKAQRDPATAELIERMRKVE